MKVYYILLLLCFIFAGNIQGQISISSLPYEPGTETFNSYNPLNSTNTSIPTGWTFSSSGTPTYNGRGTGTGNTGGYWAYGTSSPSDEYSLGALRSGTPENITYSVSFTNNSGVTISSITFSWDYEQWRYVNTSGWNCTGTGELSSNTTLNSKDFTGIASGTNGTVSVTGVSSFTLTGLSIANGQTFGITWVTTDESGSDNGIAIDNFSISANGSALSPTISINPTSLNFGSVLVGNNSAEQSYTVAGTNLTADLNISTGTSLFTISTNSGGTFGQSITLTPAGGIVSKTIYMRFTPQSATDYTRTITHTSTGATTQNLTATGKGIKAEPTNHVTNFAINTTTSNSINITWTDATGTVLPDKYLIKGSSVSFADISSPVDGTPESDGLLVKNITQGTQTVTFTGLNPSTTYYFKIFPYTNSTTDINYKTDGTVPQTTGVTTTSSTAYFRSKQSGNWNDKANWESSNDNNNWSDATTTPTSASNIITIRNGHTINITESVTIDQTIIDAGGILNYSGGTLIIANGDGDDLIIFGTFKHNRDAAAPYAASSSIRVKTGGTLEVNNNSTSASHYGTSSQIFYENGAVYYWNLSSSGFFITDNATYFPNASLSEIPVFRVNTSSISVGAGSPTIINGILQVDANTITFQNAGAKTFRNGIRGTGNVTQSSDCGQFMISGENSELGGTGTLTLSTNGLNISSTANVSLISNKTITGGTVTVQGTLTTANYYIGGTTNFALNSGANLYIGSPNGITSSGATGNIQVSGTRTFNSGANYFYNGSASQNTGIGLPSSVNNLSIDNTAGVTLSQDVTVNGILYLTNGILNIGDNNITVSSGLAASILGGTVDNFINTTGTGKLTVNNLVQETTFNFPIGHTTYSPLKINYSGNTDNFTVSVKNSFDNPPYNANHVNKQWTITEGNPGNINANLTFQWNISDENLGFTRTNDIYIGRYNGTIYESKLATLGGPGAGPFTAYATGFTAFSPFGIGNDGALPVKLASFNGIAKLRDIKINWTTAEELNNSGFDIERKSLNSDWQKIVFVNGNNKPSGYEYTDKNLTTGKYQYRLKQIDYNGNFEYHNLDGIIEVGVPAKFDLSQNYPNPFNPVTKINFDLPKAAQVSLKVYDILGKEVKTLVNEFKDAGYYNITFDASGLPSGVYFYRISAGEFSSVKKLVLLK